MFPKVVLGRVHLGFIFYKKYSYISIFDKKSEPSVKNEVYMNFIWAMKFWTDFA